MNADRPLLADTVGGLTPISLAEVTAAADLQSRIDRKYLVPAPVLADVMADIGHRLSALTIDGSRVFRYHSVYFDTARLTCYHQHLQRRRRRVKVRTRSYPDSGTCLLEVKSKGGRSQTVKARLGYAITDADRITGKGMEFVAATVPDVDLVRQLRPVLSTDYRRSTLLDPVAGTRLTCDIDLSFRAGGAAQPGPADIVLVESKSPGRAGAIDRALIRRGIRPVAISKYCLGVALMYPGVRSNPWHRLLRKHFEWSPGHRSTVF